MSKFSEDEKSVNQNSGDKQKKKSKRKIFLIYLILAAVLVGAPMYLFMGRSQLVKARYVTVEAAKDIHPLKLAYIDSEDQDRYILSCGENENITLKPGKSKITYDLKDLTTGKVKKITLRFKVVDTTAPVITVKDGITAQVNQDFDLSKYITLYDNADELSFKNITVEGKVDTTAEGTYTLKLSLKDASGNETKDELQVVVREMSAQERFLDAVDGYWHIGSWRLIFSNKESRQELRAGDFMSELTYSGSFEFVSLSDDLKEATLKWNWYHTPGEPAQQDIVIVKADFANAKIFVDLGDGNGSREYQKLANIKDLEELLPN